MLTIRDTRNDFAANPCAIAVLPVGAIEQHGGHLPVGTDLMLAEAVARPIAEQLGAYLLPGVAISASIEHRKAKGTVYLRAETLAAVIRDIAASLRHSGFERLVVVNFHGGNWILKPTIRELNRDLAPFRAILVQPELPPAAAREIFAHVAGDVHGGEFETSLMLHLYPEQVRAVPKSGARDFPPQPMLDYFDATELTECGYWGWPEAATAEKGKWAFDALVASGLRIVQEVEAMEKSISNRGKEAVTLRPMRADDIAVAHELRKLAGWNQTEKDWRGYLEFDPEGCFVAELAGRTVGTATTIRYGDRFGWIGMVLVHPESRRFGIGTQLLKAAISRLQRSGVRAVKLDATPLGKKVYLPLGFVDEYELARYEGLAPAAPAPASEVVPFAAVDFHAVVELDTRAFGADRARVLHSLSRRNPNLCFAWQGANGVRGFLIAREGVNAVQIGPWSADGATIAAELLHALFRSVAGRRVFVDVIDPNQAAVQLMRQHGFTVQRTLTRMFLGQNAHPGEPPLVFGISSPEKG